MASHISASANAPTAPTAAPHSSANSDAHISTFSTYLTAVVEGGSLPGLDVAVLAKDGTRIFRSIHGSFVADQIYRMYSNTKPVIAVAILILMERGLLTLDTELKSIIPAFESQTVLTGGTVDAPETEPLQTHITIKHLLQHTSGMAYGIFGDHVVDQMIKKNIPDHVTFFENTDLSALVERLAETPLVFQPGSFFLYSLSFDVLGRVIEVLSGCPLQDFLEQEIFSKLGMSETGFSVPTEKQHRLAPICRKNGQGFSVGPLLSPKNSVDRIADPVFISGGGGLFSTSHDYCKFALFLLNDGAVVGDGGVVTSRLLTAKSLQLMRTNHLPEGQTTLGMSYNPTFFSESFGEGFGFGLGVYVLIDPAKAAGGKLSGEGEFGWGGLASTFLIVDPVKEIAVVILTSLIPSSSLPLRAQIRWFAHWLAEQSAESTAD